jgi:hypothetical protein
MKTYSLKETEKLLSDLIEKYDLDFSVEEIKELVYGSSTHVIKWHMDLFSFFITKCSEKWVDIDNSLLDIATNAWNNFPHKKLWWKSPSSILK